MTPIPSLALDLSELSPIANVAIPFLGVLLITLGMLMGVRKRRRLSAMRGTARDQVEELKQRHAVRGDLEQLMTEVEQLAKRFAAQLDAKAARLERLIDEAETRITELKQLEEARRATLSLQKAAAPEHSTGTNETVPSPSEAAPSPPKPPDDTLKQQVCALADQGLDPIEIARQLNEHVGKIELILALRKA